MDFCLLAKNMCENIDGNISKNLSNKYSQKLLDHAKQFGADAFKTASKRTIQETAEGTGGFIVNKIANTILQQNNSETVSNEHYKEIRKGSYRSS